MWGRDPTTCAGPSLGDVGGSSSAAVVENYHGIPFKKPLRRLKEYTEIFNMLISGEKLFYEGEIYKLTQGFSLRYDRPRDHVPVWIASLTPKSLEQSGEIADGIMPVHWPSSRMFELKEQMNVGAKKIDRDVNEIVVAPHSHLFILDGNNDDAIWDEARKPLEMYINRMGNFYHEMMTRTGWEKEVAESKSTAPGKVVIVCFPAFIMSGSSSPSKGKGPIPKIPFSD